MWWYIAGDGGVTPYYVKYDYSATFMWYTGMGVAITGIDCGACHSPSPSPSPAGDCIPTIEVGVVTSPSEVCYNNTTFGSAYYDEPNGWVGYSFDISTYVRYIIADGTWRWMDDTPISGVACNSCPPPPHPSQICAVIGGTSYTMDYSPPLMYPNGGHMYNGADGTQVFLIYDADLYYAAYGYMYTNGTFVETAPDWQVVVSGSEGPCPT
jgi:hypothetical protein